jgi:hypothetical protein
LPFEPGGGGGLAVRRDQGDVEARRIVIAERPSREQRLHADHRCLGRDGKGETSLDCPAAGLGEPHHDIGLERLGRGRNLGKVDGEGRLAGVVGLRQVAKRDGLGADVFILVGLIGRIETEQITRIARPLGGLGDIDLALDVEA